MRRLLPLLAVCLLAADWDRFRGPNGTGVSDDASVPVKWTPKDTLFKVELPASGHSSPIVVGNRLFLLGATETQRLALCYDATTGKELWRKAVKGGAGKTHKKSSLASATPCSDGERVYCVFWDGKAVSLHAYTVTGEAVWDRPLGAFKSQHGPGFSPVVVGGKVIVNNDQDGKAVLLAFDAKTGKPAWSVERPAHRACYSTPIVRNKDATSVEVVVTSTAGLAGYDVATGKENWRYDWGFPAMPLRTVGSSVIVDDLIFAIAGDGSGERAMIGVKLGGKGDVTKDGLAWRRSRGTPYVPTPVALGKHLYGVQDNGTAFCLEAATGEQVWSSRLCGNVSSSPVRVGGNVFAIDEAGNVNVFAATTKALEVKARNTLGEPILSSPAVANGRMYLRGESHLFCVGKAK